MDQLCSLAGIQTLKTDSAANQDQTPNQNPKWSTAAFVCISLPDYRWHVTYNLCFYYLKHGGKKPIAQCMLFVYCCNDTDSTCDSSYIKYTLSSGSVSLTENIVSTSTKEGFAPLAGLNPSENSEHNLLLTRGHIHKHSENPVRELLTQTKTCSKDSWLRRHLGN